MKYRKANFLGNDTIEVVEAELTVPKEGEVVLKVLCTALCGSDVRLFHNGSKVTPGHEVLGRVEHPGHALHGRRCLVYIAVFCGKCPTCLAGYTNLCETKPGLMGWQYDGGFAEYMLVPEQCLMPVPDSLPDHLAPLLLDAMGTTSHGIERASGGQKPSSALVIGAGPIGLGCILVLKAMGCRRIVVKEPSAMRRDFALSLGAVPFVEESGESFPVALECSGKNVSRQLAVSLLGPLGGVCFLGESADPWQITETIPIRRNDFQVCRTFYFRKDALARNLNYLESCKNDAERLVAERGGLDDLQGMYARFARGESLKPLLVFPE